MDINAITPELKAVIAEQFATERKMWEDRIKAIETKTDPTSGEIATKTAYAELVKRIDGIQALMGQAESEAMNNEVKSFSHRFFDSDSLKDWKSRAKHKGGFTFSHEGSIWDGWLAKKDITEGSPTAPSVALSQRLPEWVFAGVRQIRVRDLIPTFTTGLGAVNYVKENSFTNAAYPQTEAAAKGHTALTFTVAQSLVQTIAHYIKASRQALDDIGQLQAAIDFKLLIGLKDEEDSELLRGDGTGAHITGLMVGGTAFDTTKNVSATDNIADTLSEALEQIEAANHTATGIVLNPINWRQMTRIKDSQGRYLLGGPGMVTEPRLWGLPVSVSNAMPTDKFLVGDFMRGCAIYDRMESRIDVSTENEDDFIKNMVTIRAEERLALAQYRSDYFVYGYLDGKAHV